MIDVSVVADDLVVGQRTTVSIRFANNGRGPCSDIVFAVRLSAGIVLMGGAETVRIPRLPGGGVQTHKIGVEATRPGRYKLTSMNFSYRDELDRPVRVASFEATLVATVAPLPPVRRPLTGRLEVAAEGGEIDLGAWDVLWIVATNHTDAVLNDVVVAVRGPFLSDDRRSGVAELRPGETARLAFSVNATDSGRHVPVQIGTTYSYRDGVGVRTRTQENRITVAVRPAAPDPRTAPREQTVLYLAASPRNLPPLQSGLGMRKLRNNLQSSRLRDRYRLEFCPAARLNDISRALLEFEPTVLEFSGHGAADGTLCVEDDIGNGAFITPEGLAGMIGQHGSTLRCVVVSACYSLRLAQALAVHVDYVIGMRDEIGDEAAIVFSEGFYIGLFNGMSVPDAFTRGQSHLLARRDLGHEHRTPLLFSGRAAPARAGDRRPYADPWTS